MESESWIAEHMSLLAAEDVGDSLEKVEALLKHHHDLERSMAARHEMLKSLDKTAGVMLDAKKKGASISKARG